MNKTNLQTASFWRQAQISLSQCYIQFLGKKFNIQNRASSIWEWNSLGLEDRSPEWIAEVKPE